MSKIIIHTDNGPREVKLEERIYSIERRYEYYEPVIFVVSRRADFMGYKLARKSTGLQSKTSEQAEADQREIAKGHPIYYQASTFKITEE